MNFSVHMDPDTIALLDRLVKTEKRSRSAVIREALPSVPSSGTPTRNRRRRSLSLNHF